MPTPRKDSAASAVTMPGTVSVTCTSTGAQTLGSSSRKMMCRRPAPTARAASMNSRSRSDRTVVRSTMASGTQPKAEKTAMRTANCIQPGSFSPGETNRVWMMGAEGEQKQQRGECEQHIANKNEHPVRDSAQITGGHPEHDADDGDDGDRARAMSSEVRIP